ncbi:MAG: helix-turn-helix transcriptional regulator [Verrucomicrobia subdivision 3 bacterium]|nr:helix-turn-helix transcriptional regulator [Limisphaerales bacterium]
MVLTFVSTSPTAERHIKREFGLCRHDWMVALRMRRAVEQLVDAARVKEAAAELGYKNQHHFSREFRKHTGHAPSQPQTLKRAH